MRDRIYKEIEKVAAEAESFGLDLSPEEIAKIAGAKIALESMNEEEAQAILEQATAEAVEAVTESAPEAAPEEIAAAAAEILPEVVAEKTSQLLQHKTAESFTRKYPVLTETLVPFNAGALATHLDREEDRRGRRSERWSQRHPWLHMTGSGLLGATAGGALGHAVRSGDEKTITGGALLGGFGGMLASSLYRKRKHQAELDKWKQEKTSAEQPPMAVQTEIVKIARNILASSGYNPDTGAPIPSKVALARTPEEMKYAAALELLESRNWRVNWDPAYLARAAQEVK